MFRILLIFSFLNVSNFILSQRIFKSQYKIEILKKKNATIDLEDYFTKLYENDSSDLETINDLSYYKYQNKKYADAIILLKKIIKNQKYANPDNFYILAQSLKYKGDYFSAKEYFKEGLAQSKKIKDRKNITKYNRELESIEWAIENEKYQMNNFETKENQIISLQSSYATGWDDSNQFIILDELDSLGLNLIYYHNFNTNKKTKILRDSTILLIGSITKIPNSNRIYFSNCNRNKQCIISTAEISNFKIINVQNVTGFELNDSITYTMPYFSDINKKKYLFYSSNNFDSKGGLDIFIGELNSYNSIINKKNLSAINSTSDEISPFYDNKTQTLYFSSNYYNGFGGIDIFKTKFINGKNSKIENIGKPFNSSYNDIYFTKNDSLYSVTSNRNINQNCCNSALYFYEKKLKNIIESKNLEDTSFIVQKEHLKNEIIKNMKKLFPITLYFHNDIPNPKSLDTITNLNYETTYNDYKNLKNIYLKKNDQQIDKNKISQFFDSTITTGYTDLNRLLNLISTEIKNGTTVKIIIKGYASPLASNKYNKNLSKRRINSVLNYINEYQNGELNMYVNKNIFIEERHFGEELSNKQVNDDPKNKKKSIYALDAALERKIELIDIIIE